MRQRGKRDWRVTAALVLLVLLTAWIQLAEWPMPVTHGIDHRDSGVFAYGGWVIAHGGAPYLEFWDQKPPLVFLLNALAFRIGGSLTAVWWLSLLACLLAFQHAWLALRRMVGVRFALAGAAVAVVSLAGTLQGGNVVELYALPIRWWLLASTLRLLELRSGSRPHRELLLASHSLAMGVGAGLLFLLRQNELLGAVALALGLLWTLVAEKRWREIGWTIGGQLAGFLLVLGAATAWLASAGALDAFWDQVFRYNFVHKIDATALMRLDAWGAVFDFLPAYGLAFVGWLWLTVRVFRRGLGSPLVRLLWVWLPVETFAVLVSGQRFPHYFLSLIPAVTALLALLLENADLRSGSRNTRLAVWSLLALLLLVNLGKFHRQLAHSYHSTRGGMVTEAADWIQAHTASDDKITIWGMVPELYLAADRTPGTRMTHVYPLLSPGYTDSTLVAEWIGEMLANRPAVLVDASSHNGRVPPLSSWEEAKAADPRPLYPALQSFYRQLHLHYAAVDTLGPWQWVMYQRVRGEP